jgi:hypothetical protein
METKSVFEQVMENPSIMPYLSDEQFEQLTLNDLFAIYEKHPVFQLWY